MPPKKPLRMSLNDLSPSMESVDALTTSIAEIKICKRLFDGWLRELDRGKWTHRSEREHELVWSIDKLARDASRAYDSAKHLLVSHRSFANAMGDMLDPGSGDDDDDNTTASSREFIFNRSTAQHRVMRSGDLLVAHSVALSEHVGMMQEDLAALVASIEQYRRTEKRTRSSCFAILWEWVLQGFTSVLSLVAAGTAFVPLARPLGAAANSTLTSGARLATALSDLVQRAPDGMDEEAFDRIMYFLQHRVPREARRAEECMSRFQQCCALLQMDDALRENRPVVMRREESRRAGSRWRSRRGQFQRAEAIVRDDTEVDEEPDLIRFT